MSNETVILLAAAASVGFFHTLFGPDHYLPFIMMGRAGQWSTRKTAWITALCGVGHVLGSVVLGLVGIAAGIAVRHLQIVEGFRGNLAAWALIAFGLGYFIWGLRRALRNRPHRHEHLHDDTTAHSHTHVHHDDHTHVHADDPRKQMTPWVLFTVFVLGPCEPLIPILMYPAARGSLLGLASVTAVFALVTIGTMLTVVMLSTYGIALLPLQRLDRYAHALAGAIVCLSGLAIQFLGL